MLMGLRHETLGEANFGGMGVDLLEPISQLDL